ncbi:hypothetical protein [Amycolatopsis sp. CA-128772]|uniref:hypothetical protein n=1 Tax=Amycolatopsis sp. CA-128772 TaxID=2073159 RepID=UPI001E5A2442|nr:hypothetical protein [Amycolatopsis sp. CA-128772]
MRLPAVSLRTRIVAAIVGVTTTATAIMAYSAYQVQANEAVGRFAWSAVRNTAADRKVLLEFTQPGPVGWLGEAPAGSAPTRTGRWCSTGPAVPSKSGRPPPGTKG